jgi:hypothetical protein
MASIAANAVLRLICSVLLFAVAWPGHAQLRDEGLKTIAILDFDLLDDQHELFACNRRASTPA